ncbi:MAG: site-specific integrase [Chitinophagales bacterium]|nr:site-specific integrase [Chitinophagales bacterium]
MNAKVSLKHYLHTGRGTEGPLPIYLRITYNRKKAEIHSGFTSTLSGWNEKEQLTKSNKAINQELLNQRAKIYELCIGLEKEGKTVSANLLKELFTGKSRIQVTVIEYLGRYIEELEARNEIKLVSLNKYRQSLNSLKSFIPSKFELPDLPISLINYDFINCYDLFLKQEYNLHKNTINKYHSRLRTILIRAQIEGLISVQPYANFKLVSVKSERSFLSSEELDKIVALDLSANSSLDRVRDIFVFSAYTGLRFQDAQNLTKANLIKVKSKLSLRYQQQKTGGVVDIPLLPIASKIIQKYENSSEREVLGLLLPKISNQKLNAYLKVIADLTGINQTLTHHMARHTFATTICLNNNMPLEDLSKLLGHSSLKTTQIHGRITQQRLTESMEKIQKKLKRTKSSIK